MNEITFTYSVKNKPCPAFNVAFLELLVIPSLSVIFFVTLPFVLFETTFCLFFASPGVGSEALEQKICVSLTTRRLPVKNIKTYTIKEGPMKAVM